MLAGCEARQMAILQPDALTMRAAVSLVAMPPVPHCDPFVLVSTCPRTPPCPQQLAFQVIKEKWPKSTTVEQLLNGKKQDARQCYRVS